MSRKRLEQGRRSEEVAAEWMIENRYKVLERNFRGYRGEVDIIAQKNTTTYLVEVRSGRTNDTAVLQGISRQKINKIVQTGMQYLQNNDLCGIDVEVLIIAVTWYNPGRPQIRAIPVY